MSTAPTRSSLAAVFVALLVATAAFASDRHGFDASNEGWTLVSYPFRSHVANPAVTALPFDVANGLPPGSVRAGDVFPETGIAAPTEHLGNQSALYGDSLLYDLLVRFSDGATYPAVVLNGGTRSLYFDTPSPPVGAWEHRSIPLSEAGWKNSGTNAPATEADMRQVLGALAGIYLYTEWHTGSDDTNIDNVRFVSADRAGIAPDAGRAAALRLSPAFPNPAGALTVFSLATDGPTTVTVEIFSLAGRRERLLAAGQPVASTMRVEWDGRDERGTLVPSGVYFVRATTRTGATITARFARVR